MLHKTSELNQKWKRTAAGSLALLLCAGSLPLQALAGSYTVGNGEQMYNSWNQANSSSDTSNNFYMDNNIDMSGYTLNVQEGNNYYIGSVSGENNTISNVDFAQSDSKGGDVTINANVSGTDTVLEVEGSNVDVTVNQNVTQTSAKTQEYPAVNVTGADVTIQGSVTTKSDAVMANDGAEVIINGSVTSDKGMGVHAYNDAEVTVKGNVTAEDLAVDAYNADVTVNGSVTSEEDRGILSRNDSTVTVKQNVTSEDTAVVTYTDSTVTVMGNVNRTGDGGAADPIDFVIDAASDSNVTVNGNVTSADGGLRVNDANVVVKGDVTTEGQTVLSNDASVSIGDDFISEKNSSTIGTHSGVFVTGSELVVTDDMQTPRLNASDDSEVFIGGNVKAKVVTVGNGDPMDPKDTEDTTTLRTGDIYWNKNSYNSGLYANGHSNTTVYGSVYGEVKAADTARVNVYGSTGNNRVQDDGFIQSQIKEDKEPTKITYHPGDNSQRTQLEALCLGYIEGSPMDDHLKNVLTKMNNACTVATGKMSKLGAFLITLTKHDDILKDKYLKGNTVTDALLQSYNQTSYNNLKKSSKINQYEVELYKANIAAALGEIEANTWLQAEREDIKVVSDLVNELYNAFVTGNVSQFPKDMQPIIRDMIKKNEITPGTAELVLHKLGYFPDDIESLEAAARRTSDMFEYVKALETTLDTVENLLTTADFVEYWATNYEDQVIALDSMLEHAELPAEQFLAVAQLRQEYAHKFIGTAKKAVDVVVDKGVGALVSKAFQPLSMAEALIDVAALVTGVDGYVDGLHNSSALVNMLPGMYNTYETAIQTVRDGDTSDAAVQQVQTSFIVLKETLKSLALSLKEVDKDLATEYQNLYNDLKYLNPGETI